MANEADGTRREIALKELGDWDDGRQTCIYCNGHVGPIAFLKAVKEFSASDVPWEDRNILILDDVQHCRFDRMTPQEADARGISWGFWKVKDGRYKVTAVFIGGGND